MHRARINNKKSYERAKTPSTPLIIIPNAPIDSFAAGAVAAAPTLGVGELLVLPVFAAAVGSVWLAFLNWPVYVVAVTPVPFLHCDGVGAPLVNTISAHLEGRN